MEIHPPARSFLTYIIMELAEWNPSLLMGRSGYIVYQSPLFGERSQTMIVAINFICVVVCGLLQTCISNARVQW